VTKKYMKLSFGSLVFIAIDLILLPNLISAAHTELVVLGFVIGVSSVPAIYYYAKWSLK
jgi:hypothetical protein